MSTGEKRKRFTEADGVTCQAPAKRKAGSRGPVAQNAAWQEEHRAAIKEVYIKFRSLLAGGNQDVLQEDFQHILDAATGPPPAVRLAARLIPRYAAAFPALLPRSLEALIRLSTPVLVTQAFGVSGSNSAADLAAATLQDSLRGIGTVCGTTCNHHQHLDQPTLAVVSSGVRHLLRCGGELHLRGSTSLQDMGAPAPLLPLEEDVRFAIETAVEGNGRLSVCSALAAAAAPVHTPADKYAAVGACLFLDHLLSDRGVPPEGFKGAGSQNGAHAPGEGLNGASPGTVPKGLATLLDKDEGLLELMQDTLNEALSGVDILPESRMVLQRVSDALPRPPLPPEPFTTSAPPPPPVLHPTFGAPPLPGPHPHMSSPTAALITTPEALNSVGSRPASVYLSGGPAAGHSQAFVPPAGNAWPDRGFPAGSALDPQGQAAAGGAAALAHADGSATLPRVMSRIPSIPLDATLQAPPPLPPDVPAALARTASLQYAADSHAGDTAPARQPLRREELPKPGGEICAAAPCLWLGNLPPHVTQAVLQEACAKHATPGAVMRVEFSTNEEAIVAFGDIRDAALCYEGMYGVALWGSRPLDARFCEDTLPLPGRLTPRRDDPDRLHLWVGGVSSKAGETEVLATLEQAQAPKPAHVLRVGGIRRGVILQFLSPTSVPAAVDALRRKVEMQMAAAAAAAQMAAAAAAAPPPPIRRPVTPPPALQQPPLPDRAPLPEFANRSLWVGQVGPNLSEKEVLEAFGKFGRLTGYRFLRNSNCAFIDFESVAGAAAARQAMHGMRFDMWALRVEFKGESKFIQDRGGRRGGLSPGRDGGRGGLLASRDFSHRRLPAIRGSPPRKRVSPSRRSSSSRHASPASERPRRSRDSRDRSPLARSSQSPTASASTRPPRRREGERRSKWGPPMPAAAALLPPPPPPPAPQPQANGPSRVTPHSNASPTNQTPPPLPPSHADAASPFEMPPPLPDSTPPPLPPAGPRLTTPPQPAVPPYNSPPLPAASAPAAARPPPMPAAPQDTMAVAPSLAHIAVPISQAPAPAGKPLQLPVPQIFPGKDPRLVCQVAADVVPARPVMVESGAIRTVLPPPVPLAPPPPLQAVAAASIPEPAWRGKLGKSGGILCDLISLDGPGTEPGSAAREPVAWPEILNVQMRAELMNVLTHVFLGCPPGLRAVRRLALAPATNAARHADQRSKFVDFLNYLSSKSRAGIIRGLPAIDPAGGARTMYLIPPTTTTAQRLGVKWEPAECLLALVVPDGHSEAAGRR